MSVVTFYEFTPTIYKKKLIQGHHHPCCRATQRTAVTHSCNSVSVRYAETAVCARNTSHQQAYFPHVCISSVRPRWTSQKPYSQFLLSATYSPYNLNILRMRSLSYSYPRSCILHPAFFGPAYSYCFGSNQATLPMARFYVMK